MAENSFQSSYEDVLKRLETISTRISDRIRTIGVGVVLFCWGFLAADKGLPAEIWSKHERWVAWTAIAAILGLLMDLLQGYANYWIANQLRKKMELQQREQGYDYRGFVYRTQTFLFVGKMVIVPCSCASLIVLLWMMVW